MEASELTNYYPVITKHPTQSISSDLVPLSGSSGGIGADARDFNLHLKLRIWKLQHSYSVELIAGGFEFIWGHGMEMMKPSGWGNSIANLT
jgi:hypothetical protein